MSRLKSYEDCPYGWLLKYIKGKADCDRFYATYGSFMHRLLEQYYRGKLSKTDMLIKYLTDFKTEVKGSRPKDGIATKLFEQGCEYLRTFTPLPFTMLDVEMKVEFSTGGHPFAGHIDYLGEKGGEYYIVDNKSRMLNPRSKRSKPAKHDMELDLMLRDESPICIMDEPKTLTGSRHACS